MSSAAIWPLVLASLDTGSIVSGTTVIDLELSEVRNGACTLQIDAIDFEGPPNSWDILFDAEDNVGDTYLIDLDIYPGEGACFLRSGAPDTIYMCEAETLTKRQVTWDASLVVPPGEHPITVWSDGGEDIWQPIGELELICGSCDTYGDFDGSGEVDATDLVQLLAMWNQDVAYTEFQYLDANGDGTINGRDLATLQGNWGPTCPE